MKGNDKEANLTVWLMLYRFDGQYHNVYLMRIHLNIVMGMYRYQVGRGVGGGTPLAPVHKKNGKWYTNFNLFPISPPPFFFLHFFPSFFLRGGAEGLLCPLLFMIDYGISYCRTPCQDLNHRIRIFKIIYFQYLQFFLTISFHRIGSDCDKFQSKSYQGKIQLKSPVFKCI